MNLSLGHICTSQNPRGNTACHGTGRLNNILYTLRKSDPIYIQFQVKTQQIKAIY